MSSDSVILSVGMFLIAQHSSSELCHQLLMLPVSDIPANIMTSTEREVAERSILIKNMMDDVGDEATTEAIPIPNVGQSETTWGQATAKLWRR